MMTRRLLCLLVIVTGTSMTLADEAASDAKDALDKVRERHRRAGGYLLPARINGENYIAVVNTACLRSVVNVVDDSDPFPGRESQPIRFRSPTGIENRKAYIVPFSVMDGPEKLLPVGTGDISTHSSEGDRCAVVGMDYLRHFAINFQPRSRHVEISGKARPPQGVDPVPLQLINGAPWADISLPGISRHPVFIGTGIPQPLILTLEVLRSLERDGHAVRVGTRRFETAGWQVMTTQYLVRRVEFQGTTFVDVPTLAGPARAVGLGILEHFDWTLDFPNQQAWFKPHSESQAVRLPLDISGIEFSLLNDNTMEIRAVHRDSVAESAGLEVGDKVETINGRPIHELSRGSITLALAQDDATLQLAVRRNETHLNIALPLKRNWTYPPRWPEEKIVKRAPLLPDLKLE